jgi:hypothetical protein
MSEERHQQLPLFDRVGGRIFTTLIIEKLCDRMLVDPKLDEVLDGVNPTELKTNLTDLAVEVLFGRTEGAATALADVSQRTSLSQSLFNRGISHLIAALVWAGITRALIEEILDVVTPLADLLTKPGRPAASDGGGQEKGERGHESGSIT